MCINTSQNVHENAQIKHLFNMWRANFWQKQRIGVQIFPSGANFLRHLGAKFERLKMSVQYLPNSIRWHISLPDFEIRIISLSYDFFRMFKL